jgi:hypothetical protein
MPKKWLLLKNFADRKTKTCGKVFFAIIESGQYYYGCSQHNKLPSLRDLLRRYAAQPQMPAMFINKTEYITA